jgi:hypothetical protein
VTPLERLPVLAIAGAMGLGFALSLLILMDQNISSAMVNTPLNKYLSKCQVKVNVKHFRFRQFEKRTGVSLGFVCYGHFNGRPISCRIAMDARPCSAFATTRPRIGGC